MYREPKLPHVLCGLSFCEACHFVRPIPVLKVKYWQIVDQKVTFLCIFFIKFDVFANFFPLI